MDLNLGTEVIDGRFVNTEVRRVIDAIRQYEPEIEVQYIPLEARTPGQAAYRLIHRPRDGAPYIMFTVRRDEDFDSRILAKVMANDNRNGVTSLSELEAFEAAERAVAHQRYLDMVEEANDIAFHVLKTKKNTYKVNDDFVIKEGIPFNAARY